MGRAQTQVNANNKNWSVRMADSTIARFPLLADKWDYQWGLVLKGFEQVWRVTGEQKYFDYIQHNIDAFVQPDGTIRGYRVDEYNVDRLNTGKVLFNLYEKTGEEKYKRALDLLRSQLDTQPRTPSGGFWHKQIYPNQMWLDGIYMADAFYAQYQSAFPRPSKGEGQGESAFDDIAHQIILIEQHTRDPQTGLLYHAWDESKQQRWANPETGCSPHFWGRAMGWYVMALVDVLDFLPCDHSQRGEIIAILNRTMDALMQVQDSARGGWYQVLDNPSSSVIASREATKQSPTKTDAHAASSQRPLLAMTQGRNYLESSASCMFVYAMVKGAHSQYLPPKYLDVAQRAYAGILQQFIHVDNAGQVHLTGTCRSAGLGGTPYRDGSYEYYIGEPVVIDNHHGVGAFLLASHAIESSI